MTHVWTERELAALRRHYPNHGAKWDGWAAWLPGRTANAISIKASQCGVRFDGTVSEEGREDGGAPDSSAALAVDVLSDATRLRPAFMLVGVIA